MRYLLGRKLTESNLQQVTLLPKMDLRHFLRERRVLCFSGKDKHMM